jgi:hypothetical protein
MGSNGVVSIRVGGLGVSITVAEGSIAIELTKQRPCRRRKFPQLAGGVRDTWLASRRWLRPWVLSPVRCNRLPVT